MALNPKQQRFCEEYLIDLNATQAAIRAGYSGGKSAEVTGAKLLRNAKVLAEVERLQGLRSERTQLSADLALEYCHDLASSDIVPVVEALKDGRLNELPLSLRRAIKSVNVRIENRESKQGNISIESYSVTMHSKDSSPLALLFKHLGLSKDDAEAISTLTTYGKVTRTERGIVFEYADSTEGTAEGDLAEQN